MPAQPISPARMAANLANAQLSTGPKTVAGKARARANAVKHGLTGAGIALPTEDKAEIEQRFASIQEELMPQTVLGGFFAYQIALNTVRCQRSARYEAALATTRIQEAEAAFDQARRDEARELFARLYQDPVTLRAELLKMPEGVERLVGGLQTLRADLARLGPGWSQGQANGLAIMLGANPQAQLKAAALVLSDAVMGNFAGIRPEWIAHLTTDADRRAWAAQALDAELQGQVQKLFVHCETLDLDPMLAERELVAEQAAFAASQESTLGRRYEAAATREIHRALREFRIIEADHAAEVAPTPTEPAPPVEPKSEQSNDLPPTLGSFGNGEITELTPADPTPVPADPAANVPQITPAMTPRPDDLGAVPPDAALPCHVESA